MAFAEGELCAEATVAKFATVQTEGGRTVSRDIECYNLDVIISVCYRVKSHRGKQFRIWAAHGQTAAEVIHARVDAARPFMGLKTTRPGGIIRKEDVAIAKNYLDAEELGTLNRIVNAYIEFAELRALQRKVMTMRDWITKLDEFLKLSEHELLDHAGRIPPSRRR